MVGCDILRLEADARRDLPGLEYIVAIDSDGLSWQSHSARRLHTAGNRQAVNSESLCCATNPVTVSFRSGLVERGEGVVHLGNAVTLLAVEGDIPKVAVFLAMPYADKSQAGIQPVLYLKGH